MIQTWLNQIFTFGFDTLKSSPMQGDLIHLIF